MVMKEGGGKARARSAAEPSAGRAPKKPKTVRVAKAIVANNAAHEAAEVELQRDHVESAYELVQAMHSPPEELVTRIQLLRIDDERQPVIVVRLVGLFHLHLAVDGIRISR